MLDQRLPAFCGQSWGWRCSFFSSYTLGLSGAGRAQACLLVLVSVCLSFEFSTCVAAGPDKFDGLLVARPDGDEAAPLVRAEGGKLQREARRSVIHLDAVYVVGHRFVQARAGRAHHAIH